MQPISPQTTLAVILGASKWPHASLPGGRPYAKSAEAMREYLLDPKGWGLKAGQLLDLFDDGGSPTEIIIKIGEFLTAKAGMSAFADVFVYYLGHGLFHGPNNHYHLALRSTRTDYEGASSLPIAELADRLRKGARFQRRFVVLDSCFAASALASFQGDPRKVAIQKAAEAFPIRGTLIYCSSNKNDPSIALPNHEYTMFSGALIHSLKTGEPGLGARLNISELDRLVWMRIRHEYGEDEAVRPEVHCPDKRHGDLAELELFPNPAFKPAPEFVGTKIQKYGTLTITSSRGGALFVDGYKSETLGEFEVYRLEKVKAGEHHLKISRPGFPDVEKSIVLQPDAHLTLDLSPPKKRKTWPWLAAVAFVSLALFGIINSGWNPFLQRKAGQVEVFEIARVEFEMVWCPPGEFLMGSPETEPEREENETQHKVTLTKGFWLGKTEVTQAQWKAVMGDLPQDLKGDSKFLGDQMPVIYVSWGEAQIFIQKLNGMIGGGAMRLPTEAEWEYACRARAKEYSRFSFGDRITTDQVNYNGKVPPEGSPKGTYRATTVAVKSLPANAWGLHEMHGNVWEWCQDWYGGYLRGKIVDPKGAEAGQNRVLRGGSWPYFGRYVRSAYRDGRGPDFRYGVIGFRLARG